MGERYEGRSVTDRRKEGNEKLKMEKNRVMHIAF